MIFLVFFVGLYGALLGFLMGFLCFSAVVLFLPLLKTLFVFVFNLGFWNEGKSKLRSFLLFFLDVFADVYRFS